MELIDYKNTSVKDQAGLKTMRDTIMANLGTFAGSAPVDPTTVVPVTTKENPPLEAQIAFWYNANPQLLNSVFTSAKFYFNQILEQANNDIFKIHQTIVDQGVLKLTLPDNPDKEVSFLTAYMFHMFPYYERLKHIEKTSVKNVRLVNGDNITLDSVIEAFVSSKVWNKQRGITHVDMVDVRMYW